MTALRAFYRGYSTRSGRQAGQVRKLHILRPEPVGREPNQTLQAFCHLHAWPGRDSPPMFIDPVPIDPPTGLSWCAKCLGGAAERLGWLHVVATLVAGGSAVPA